jgi:hypothetical protein
MKKYLLFASAAFFAVSVNAQDRSKTVLMDVNRLAKIDIQSQNLQPIKQVTAPNAKASSAISIGTSDNVYGILGDRQNQVVYNPAINTVAFCHRQNAGGPGGPNASGIISLDFSTNGGATWTVNPFQTTPTGSGSLWNGNRYPNIGLYNPTGNTNSANAYMVEVGPALETGTNSNENGWAKTFRSTSKLDGTNLDETYNFNSYSTQNDPNEWGAAGLYVTANGDAWYASTNNNNSSNTSPNPAYNVADNYSKYFLTKGVWNNSTNKYDWTTTDTIVPGWNTTLGTSGTVNAGGLMNMAWSPDGNTGYFVVMGSWGTANTMMRPYVMKTTDAGATWNQYADYDFSNNTLLQCMIQPSTSTGTVRPFFSSYDVVVDNNNQLKIFGEILSGSSAHADSLNYVYTARQSGHLYETSTNSSGGWDVAFVDSVYVDDFEYDATNQLSHYVRPQAARSQDGSKLFYTWLGSDPSFSTEREYPNVYATGHEVSSNTWTPITDLTTNLSGAEYVTAYQTMAVDVIENGGDKSWELPIVYGTNLNGTAITDGASPVQWHYLKGIGFDQVEFTRTAIVDPCAVSVDELSLVDGDVNVYPNPTNGIIEINVADATNFNYTIIDVVGNVVTNNTVNGNRTTINLTNNALGVYFVTINTNNGSITKKVMLTK